MKVIAITLVVFGHAPTALGNTRMFVYSFHMPLFFMLSGYLYKERTVKEEFIKCMRSLYIPYLIYVGVLSVYAWLHFGEEFSVYRLLRMFTGALENISGVYSQLWFLVSLITIRMAMACLRKVSPILVCFSAFLVCWLFQGYMSQAGVDWFQICSSVLALPFFAFGMVCHKYELVDKFLSLGKFKYLILVVCLSFAVCLSISNGEVDMFQFLTGKSMTVFYVVAIVECFVFFCVGRLLLNLYLSPIKVLASGTILILAFHKFFIGKGVECLGLTNPGSVMALSAVVVFVFYLPIFLIGKYAPFLLGKYR